MDTDKNRWESHGLYEKTLIGLPDDPPTKALFEFVEEALKK